MADIEDFPCGYENAVGIEPAVTKGADVTFPEVHFDAAMMARLSQAVQAHSGSPLCALPFCHTVEAEALGAHVALGDAAHGPRGGTPAMTCFDQVAELPPIDFSQGRIAAVLDACTQLAESGQQVVLEVCGPVTILTTLLDPTVVFKAMRKQPEDFLAACRSIGDQLLEYMALAKQRGVAYVSYGDVVCSVGVLGPKRMEWMTREFLFDFVRQAQQLSDEGFLLMLCPKITLALIGCNLAQAKNIALSAAVPYLDALDQVRGSAQLCGTRCYKDTRAYVADTFKMLVLREEA